MKEYHSKSYLHRVAKRIVFSLLIDLCILAGILINDTARNTVFVWVIFILASVAMLIRICLQHRYAVHSLKSLSPNTLELSYFDFNAKKSIMLDRHSSIEGKLRVSELSRSSGLGSKLSIKTNRNKLHFLLGGKQFIDIYLDLMMGLDLDMDRRMKIDLNASLAHLDTASKERVEKAMYLISGKPIKLRTILNEIKKVASPQVDVINPLDPYARAPYLAFHFEGDNNEETYKRLTDLINQFHGKLKWIMHKEENTRNHLIEPYDLYTIRENYSKRNNTYLSSEKDFTKAIGKDKYYELINKSISDLPSLSEFIKHHY